MGILIGVVLGLLLISWIYFFVRTQEVIAASTVSDINPFNCVEIEAFIADGVLVAKALTMKNEERKLRILFSGGPSMCHFSENEPVLLDVRGKIIRTVFTDTGSPLAPCTFDVRFMFARFRTMILVPGSVIFVNEPVTDEETSTPCMRTTASGRGLCLIRQNGIDYHMFSDSMDHYDMVADTSIVVHGGKVLDIQRGLNVERTSERVVDVDMGALASDHEVWYDMHSGRIRFQDRHPSKLVKQFAAVLSFIITVFCIVRIMYHDTYRIPAFHFIMLMISIGAIILALASRANALSSRWFFWPTVVVLIGHTVLELIRFSIHLNEKKKNGERRRGIMLDIDLKPDLALVLIALILTTYIYAVHSLVVIPTFMVLLYTTKTVSEGVNMRWIVGEDRFSIIMYMASVIMDVGYTLILWHFPVFEFMNKTLVADLHIQGFLLAVLTISGGFFMASLRFESVISQKVTPS